MPEFKEGFKQLHEYESSSLVIEVWQNIREDLINKLILLIIMLYQKHLYFYSFAFFRLFQFTGATNILIRLPKVIHCT